MPTEPIPIANGFAGLDRQTAPFRLEPTKSPATVNAGPSGAVQGLLGARNGRQRVANMSYNVMGVISLNIPGLRRRLVATSDGTVTAVAVPWPSLNITFGLGWDRINTPASGFSAAQVVGVGSATSAEALIGTPITPSTYAARVATVQFPASFAVSAGGTSGSGTSKLQANVGGSWVDIITLSVTWSTAAMTAVSLTLGAFGSGSLTKFRVLTTIAAGASSTFDCDWSGIVFRFLYGAQLSNQTAV